MSNPVYIQVSAYTKPEYDNCSVHVYVFLIYLFTDHIMEEQQEDKIYKFLRKRKVDESILSELKNQKVIMINVK